MAHRWYQLCSCSGVTVISSMWRSPPKEGRSRPTRLCSALPVHISWTYWKWVVCRVYIFDCRATILSFFLLLFTLRDRPTCAIDRCREPESDFPKNKKAKKWNSSERAKGARYKSATEKTKRWEFLRALFCLFLVLLHAQMCGEFFGEHESARDQESSGMILMGPQDACLSLIGGLYPTVDIPPKIPSSFDSSDKGYKYGKKNHRTHKWVESRELTHFLPRHFSSPLLLFFALTSSRYTLPSGETLTSISPSRCSSYTRSRDPK